MSLRCYEYVMNLHSLTILFIQQIESNTNQPSITNTLTQIIMYIYTDSDREVVIQSPTDG